MGKIRVYLDTSVFSALHDIRAPERMRQTSDFWARIGSFEASTSQLTLREIAATPDPSRRHQIEELLRGVTILSVSEEMENLADRYVASRAFTSLMRADAVHVAVATLSALDVLVSWNFKHLVNRRRRAQINLLNLSWGLRQIEILAPPEM